MVGIQGTIGHVAHGKSTVVKAISGVMTVRFKNELVRNITIKLGYANAKVCPISNFYVSLRLTGNRFTNVKMKRALDQDATGHTAQTRRIIHHANVQDVDIVCDSFDMSPLSTVQDTTFSWLPC